MRTAPTTPTMIKTKLLSAGVCVVVCVSINSTDGGSPVVHGCIVDDSADVLMYIVSPEPDVSGIVVPIIKSVLASCVDGTLPVWHKQCAIM